MKKIHIIYWSGTGNTKTMAEAIGEGVKEAGAEAVVTDVSSADRKTLAEEKVFALGCSAMGAEQLEESEMEPFVSGLEGFIKGKKIALFGSYGWGDGEWMRSWEARLKEKGAEIINGEGLITTESPDEEALSACRSLGEALAAL